VEKTYDDDDDDDDDNEVENIFKYHAYA